MIVYSDFRELLAQSLMRAADIWNISDTVVTEEAVRDAVMLGDETTFRAAAGINFGEYKRRYFSQFVSSLNSGELDDVISVIIESPMVRAVKGVGAWLGGDSLHFDGTDFNVATAGQTVHAIAYESADTNATEGTIFFRQRVPIL